MECVVEQCFEEFGECVGGFGGGCGIDVFEDEILQVIVLDGFVCVVSEEVCDKFGLMVLFVDDDFWMMIIDGECVLVVLEDLDCDEMFVFVVFMEDDVEIFVMVVILLVIVFFLFLLFVVVMIWFVVGCVLCLVIWICVEVDGIIVECLYQCVFVLEIGDEIVVFVMMMNGMFDWFDVVVMVQWCFVLDVLYELCFLFVIIWQYVEFVQVYFEVMSIGEFVEIVFEEGLCLQGIVEFLLLFVCFDEGVGMYDEVVDFDDIVLSEVW